MSLMGIDIGTTGCKAGLFSETGRPLALAYREYPTLHRRPGWAELDSAEVVRLVKASIREAATAAPGDPVTALCVSAMGEAMTPVSASGDILGPAILSSDIRGGEYARQLEEQMGQEPFYNINPNILAANYSLPKLLWMKDHDTQVFNQAWKFLLWTDLVSYLFGGEAVTSYSHANRTLLFDLQREDWSGTLLDWGGISRDLLPAVAPSGTVTGTVAASFASELGLSRKAKIVLGGHDQCCNALGAGIIRGGKAVCGIGTMECITPVFDRIPPLDAMLRARLSIEHHVLSGLYLSFIYNQSGVLLKWFRDVFAAADRRMLAEEADIYDALLAEMPEAPTGLLVLPHFEPTGAPEYLQDSAGVIAGLHTDTTRGTILKAIIEGAAFYFYESLEALRRLDIDTSAFIATGGAAKSDVLLQIRADIFGTPFVRLKNTECGVAGAAMLSGIATGVYANAEQAAEQFVARDRVFEPGAGNHERYASQFNRYKQLYPNLRELLGTISRDRIQGQAVQPEQARENET